MFNNKIQLKSMQGILILPPTLTVNSTVIATKLREYNFIHKPNLTPKRFVERDAKLFTPYNFSYTTNITSLKKGLK